MEKKNKQNSNLGLFVKNRFVENQLTFFSFESALLRYDTRQLKNVTSLWDLN